ncbi:hypothetical protein AHAS_Ahas10G0088200 [Arachis hypogaea]
MKRTLSRYNKCTNSSEVAIVECKVEEDSKMEEALKDEIAELERKQLYVLDCSAPQSLSFYL